MQHRRSSPTLKFWALLQGLRPIGGLFPALGRRGLPWHVLEAVECTLEEDGKVWEKISYRIERSVMERSSDGLAGLGFVGSSAEPCVLRLSLTR